MYVKNKAGQELRGYMLPPANYVQGRKYPAILDVHGGPKCAYGKGFFHEMQYWASKGYAVIFTNPRGSSGSGSLHFYASQRLAHWRNPHRIPNTTKAA